MVTQCRSDAAAAAQPQAGETHKLRRQRHQGCRCRRAAAALPACCCFAAGVLLPASDSQLGGRADDRRRRCGACCCRRRARVHVVLPLGAAALHRRAAHERLRRRHHAHLLLRQRSAAKARRRRASPAAPACALAGCCCRARHDAHVRLAAPLAALPLLRPSLRRQGRVRRAGARALLRSSLGRDVSTLHGALGRPPRAAHPASCQPGHAERTLPGAARTPAPGLATPPLALSPPLGPAFCCCCAGFPLAACLPWPGLGGAGLPLAAPGLAPVGFFVRAFLIRSSRLMSNLLSPAMVRMGCWRGLRQRVRTELAEVAAAAVAELWARLACTGAMKSLVDHRQRCVAACCDQELHCSGKLGGRHRPARFQLQRQQGPSAHARALAPKQRNASQRQTHQARRPQHRKGGRAATAAHANPPPGSSRGRRASVAKAQAEHEHQPWAGCQPAGPHGERVRTEQRRRQLANHCTCNGWVSTDTPGRTASTTGACCDQRRRQAQQQLPAAAVRRASALSPCACQHKRGVSTAQQAAHREHACLSGARAHTRQQGQTDREPSGDRPRPPATGDRQPPSDAGAATGRGRGQRPNGQRPNAIHQDSATRSIITHSAAAEQRGACCAQQSRSLHARQGVQHTPGEARTRRCSLRKTDTNQQQAAGAA